ncbi:MAG TPA: CoA-binding protein [Thermodesulfobacteriota bacterium]|nr:CoA-binding protein [Deltaproteobacteria bacterium]HNR14240.1 CoA-binding protein [Thermodesulfobacteriota bacterium]HNU72589.1 CoA-binding protein [Thermodesulfobacteriota bacterium]HOC38749.1 CoA-binding protein [Thermodesulfobacteriota bacterium]HQO78164.1 CoA-binding protein [Thermodesulfobacteriota bacterium]
MNDVEPREILKKYNSIVVYGMSANPEKASHVVPKYLSEHGYQIIPVNPKEEKILGRESYSRLQDVEEQIDIVEVFRPSGEAVSIVEECLERKKKRGDVAVIWLQEGIRNEDARNLAEKNGITFVQDRCMYKEHRRSIMQK